MLEWNESTLHFEIRGVLDAGEYDLLYWQQMSRDLTEGIIEPQSFYMLRSRT